jgi:hypothetical protein
MQMLAQKGMTDELVKVRNKQKEAMYDRAIASSFGALKAKDPRTVQSMKPEDWDKVSQADMQGMKPGALAAGATASVTFRQNLESAMDDPIQAQYFNATAISEALKGAEVSSSTTGSTPRTGDDAPITAEPTPGTDGETITHEGIEYVAQENGFFIQKPKK